MLTAGRNQTGRAPGTYVNDSLATPALLAEHPRLVAHSANNRILRALPVDGRVPFGLAGAIGDGITDEHSAVAAALACS